MSRPATQAQLAHRAKIHGAAIATGFEPMIGPDGKTFIDDLLSKRRAGRKPKHGTPMKVRHIRMTDEQWEAARRIGMDRLRELVMQAAK